MQTIFIQIYTLPVYFFLFGGTSSLWTQWKQTNSVPEDQHQESVGEGESLIRELRAEPGEHTATEAKERKT